MEQRLNRDILPRAILDSIEVIRDLLLKTLVKEIHISTTEGMFMKYITGETPSPPPEAERSKAKRTADLFKKHAKKAKNKKTPDEVGAALRDTQKSLPPIQEEPQGTYRELYGTILDSTTPAATIKAWHMLGKKLRQDQSADSSSTTTKKEQAATNLFKAANPPVSSSRIRMVVMRVWQVYDITEKLAPNQILKIRGLSVDDIAGIMLKQIRILQRYCQ